MIIWPSCDYCAVPYAASHLEAIIWLCLAAAEPLASVFYFQLLRSWSSGVILGVSCHANGVADLAWNG